MAKRTVIALAVALLAGGPAGAAEMPSEMLEALKHLQDRLARLEARNIELERQLVGQTAGAVLEARVRQLESAKARMEEALASERLSQNEPEIATRLKAMEFQALGMQKQARMVEALEGIAAGVSFTTVAQHANGKAETQLSWRGDAQVSLPGGHIGLNEGALFFHFRTGQGNGLAGLNPTFSATNASAFQLGGAGQADDASPILAQAWYQLQVPLDEKPLSASRRHMEVTFGKIDPFLFFDQNTAADDETTRFMNLAFVHNPLLDTGGGAGLDAYGFTPGLRLAYQNDQFKPTGWGVSMGMFGSGGGAAFNDSLKRPFVIAQAETRQRFFEGLNGNYRAYLWHNGRATPFNNAAESNTEAQAGWGVSVDQRVSENLALWGRYGQSSKGQVQFDRALTLGAEVTGNAWGRGADSLGLAVGWLRASDEFKTQSATLDADGAGGPDFGWSASGEEQLAELYYRWRVNPQFELSPDYQFIRHSGANGAAGAAHILGLRAQITF
ncbi:MAG: carbohydrate porin [Pseudomonadota bacterium]|nr:carbohydrate porin [Pseudomonadota bacterium]